MFNFDKTAIKPTAIIAAGTLLLATYAANKFSNACEIQVETPKLTETRRTYAAADDLESRMKYQVSRAENWKQPHFHITAKAGFEQVVALKEKAAATMPKEQYDTLNEKLESENSKCAIAVLAAGFGTVMTLGGIYQTLFGKDKYNY